MDLDFRRPQRPVAKQNLQRSSQPAVKNQPKMQEVVKAGLSYSANMQTSSFGNVALPTTKPIDFTVGAKAFKKRQFLYSITRGIIKAAIIVVVIVAILGAFGFWLNNKYSGRALPLSYVGDISVSGMTQNQIRTMLDSRASSMEVKFVDGGLIRKVPLTAFSVKFDTESVSKQAVTSGFSPFAYLNRKRIEVPVTVNENQIDGYLRLNIYKSQTKSENAELIKEKNKLVIKPEVIGFRSDSTFIANRIKIALTTMSEPVVNVNAVTVKPNINKVDLEDDLSRANKMLTTLATIRINNSNQKISDTQKLEWLTFNEMPGTKNLNISFNKTLIRKYVSDIATRYQYTPKIDTNSITAGSTVSVNGTKAENIDEVTDGIFESLNTGVATIQTLKFKNALVETSVNNSVMTPSTNTQNSVTAITPTAASTSR